MASQGLSTRGSRIAASLTIPGRYPPKEVSNKYDKDHNPDGIISLATAENVCGKGILPIRKCTNSNWTGSYTERTGRLRSR